MRRLGRAWRRSLAAASIATLLVAANATAAGWLDSTFGSGGAVQIAPPQPYFTSLEYLGVRAGPTGRIFIAAPYGPDQGFYIRVLGSTGSPSSGFNAGHPLFIDGSADHTLRPLGLFPNTDGGLTFAWYRGDFGDVPHVRVMRRAVGGGLVKAALVPQGQVDSTEGMAVTTATRLPGGSIRLCAADRASLEHRLLGLTPTLDPDDRLGASFYRVIDAPCRVIGSDAAGHIYLAGPTTVDTRAAIEVVRMTSSGTIDTAWGTAGHLIVDQAAHDLELVTGPIETNRAVTAPSILALANGSILLAARAAPTTSQSWQPAVIRVTPGGAADSGFGTGGIATFTPAAGRYRLLAFDVDAFGRPILSLILNPGDGTARPYLARVTPAGVLDATFGQLGLVPLTRAAQSLDLDGLGRILAVAADGGTLIVARRNP